jgi:NADH-ubiquinone oxidoreductase chain 2
VFTLLPTNPYFALLVLFSVSGSSLLVSSTSLLALYLSLELQSFAVYVLAALYRESETATDAGLTYFLLGGLSSCFILLGSAQLYAALGVTRLDQVYVLLTAGLTPLATMVGFSLTVLAAGLSFKIAAAPFHQWAPDVYDRVPTIVSTWLQTMPKIAVLGLMLEITVGLGASAGLGSDSGAWTGTLMLMAVLSLVVGSVLGLAQVRVKRLLAYSTISHVGFLLLSLTAFSVDGVGAFLFYLVQYSLTSLAALSLLLAFGYALRGRSSHGMPSRAHQTDLELLSELTGRVATHPLLCLGFAALLFSMAGVPPFVGFFAKQAVLESSLAAHYAGLSVLAVLVSVVSASYYLKVVRLMHFSSTPVLSPSVQPLAAAHTFTLSTLVLLVSAYALLPSLFLDSTRALALTLLLG